MVNNINNCLHCQNKAIMTTMNDGRDWAIKCTHCPAMMVGRREEEERYLYLDARVSLIRSWNRCDGK